MSTSRTMLVLGLGVLCLGGACHRTPPTAAPEPPAAPLERDAAEVRPTAAPEEDSAAAFQTDLMPWPAAVPASLPTLLVPWSPIVRPLCPAFGD